MAFPNDWSYRRKITISGSSGVGTGYQILLKIGESSGSSDYDFHLDNKSAKFPSQQDDGGDFRFTLDDGTTLLPLWVEKVEGTSPNRTAHIWVKVNADLSTDQNIYIYFGNANAENVSNGEETFELFDDFDGSSLDSNKWIAHESVTISESELFVSTGGSSYIPVRSKNTFDRNIAFVARARASSYGDYTISILWDDDDGNLNTYSEHSYLSSNGLYWRHCTSGKSDYLQYSLTPQSDVYYKLELRLTTTDIECYVDGNGAVNTNSDNSGSKYLGFDCYDGSAARYDWVLVRKYTVPEPVFNSVDNIELPHTLQGTVCDKNGNPITGTSVKIFLLDKDTGELLGSTTSNSEDGSWSITTWSNKTLAVFALEGTYGEDTDIAGAEFLEVE